jgi:ubiquinone/menaquinone biosynthesis C-methylase UbiE
MKIATLEPKQPHEVALANPANFNRLAQLYRWLEWFTFGPILWRCRCAFLAEMKSRQSALVIGDGDGRFTAQLLHQNPQITVEAVDGSDAMLRELTRRSNPDADRLTIQHADARDFNPARRDYDLVATHFFLDCLSTDEVSHLASRLRGSVGHGAQWVVSEFAVPKTLYGRLVARPLVAALYRAFGWLTGLRVRHLPNHTTALTNAGFILVQRREWLFGLLGSELWQAGKRS